MARASLVAIPTLLSKWVIHTNLHQQILLGDDFVSTHDVHIVSLLYVMTFRCGYIRKLVQINPAVF